ncbi:MAG: YfiR family protein [Verrucomicrobiota bacterium]|nr:YfiR family protein [Verrucomicrobiota bacterium]
MRLLKYIVFLLFLFQFVSFADKKTDAENRIKAAFIYNFTRFIVWPQKKTSEKKFVIGVLGTSSIKKSISKLLKNKYVGDNEIKIKRFVNMRDVNGCQILFISDEFINPIQKSSANFIPWMQKSNVLIICNSFSKKDNLKQIGMVEFVILNDRVRFFIDKKSLDKAGLNMSSKLLRLAQNYK